ncbi:MAG: 1-acyl-sn-glycerol-3-phosphate acyltransferase [Rhizobiales bacterium]|nr:1-acyl-sn-glycerol-3-phosphate acyltransferase [Hyphomicrobiales bacterium]
MPYRCIIEVAKSWGRTSTWLLRVICGTRVEIRGIDKIPWGPLLIASKHQSTWETFGIISLFVDPAFILKRELLWLPLFGWYAWKGQMIPVNRGARAQALATIAREARVQLARGRQIIIFPEGTRRPAGAKPSYRFGVVHLYAEIGVSCLPIALNSGLYWPRRSLLRYPGTIRVEILDPIPPGLDKEAFAQRLRDTIEEATARLVAEGERELAALGYDVTARRRGSRPPSAAPPEDEVRSPDSRAPRVP